jgi:hypothetical protein
MNAAEHLEHHLGPIAQGWSSRSLPGVQVCRFREQPDAGLDTLATLGLSHTPLALSATKRVRQELLFVAPEGSPVVEFAQLLWHVADEMLRKGEALLRGAVVHLGERIAAESRSEALYASMPVVFADSIATLDATTPPTAFVWLVPVLPEEVRFIHDSGWDAFEDRLEAVQPDLFDLTRSSAVQRRG